MRWLLPLALACTPEVSEPTGPATRVSGSATWDTTFHPDAGKEDCAYTRNYEGVLDTSKPWICPDCEVIYELQTTMTATDEACYLTLGVGPLPPMDWIGWSAEGEVFRSTGRNGVLSPQGEVTADETGQQWSNVSSYLDFDFVVSGHFDPVDDPALDPQRGFTPTATPSCAEPSGAPAYEGDYAANVGDPMPDANLLDSCGDIVRIHDFTAASALVLVADLESVASSELADQVSAWAAAEDVEVITLMAPSWIDRNQGTPASLMARWQEEHALEGPVLSGRGFGGATLGLALEPTWLHPAWALVDDGIIVAIGEGEADLEAWSALLAR